MLAKRFFYVCAALLCLVLAYHFGAARATAQAPASPVVVAGPYGIGNDDLTVFTANGDVYGHDRTRGYWRYVGNAFAPGAPGPQVARAAIKARQKR